MVFGLDLLVSLANSFGFLGIVIIGFLSSFTLFLPSPVFIVVFFLGSVMNPLLVGLAAGLGSAIGEMVGYAIGYGIEKLAQAKKKKIKQQVRKVEKLFERYHPDLIIFLFSVLPLVPIDAIGIFCGAVGYSKKKFFVFVLFGKLIKFTTLAFAGFYGLHAILNYLKIEI